MLQIARPHHSHTQFKLGDKKRLYSELAEKYFLPPRDSYGVTKKYLDKVSAGTVWRVELITMKRFMAEMRPSQMKRAVYTCKFETYIKIERVLMEKGEKSLGYETGLIPDGEWLYKVARYVDRSNVCGLFMMSLEGEGEGRSDSERVYRAQKRAEKMLMDDTGIGKREGVRSSVESLVQCCKRVVSREAEVANITLYLEVLERQLKNDRRVMENQLAGTALQMYQEGRGVSAEEALGKVDEEKKRVCDTVRFVYATDRVMCRDEWIKEMMRQFESKSSE